MPRLAFHVVQERTLIERTWQNVCHVGPEPIARIWDTRTVSHVKWDFSKPIQAVVIVQLVLLEVIVILNTLIMVDSSLVNREPITSGRDRRTRVRVSNVQMGRLALKQVPRTRRSVNNAHQEPLIMRPDNHNVNHAG